MRYTIIGGINGVGKSTIYSILPKKELQALGKRINVDEIVSNYGNWNDISVQYMAARQAVKQIKACLDARIDFHQETTLAGQSIIQTIKTSKLLGYTVHLWYIYVTDVNIAKKRVRTRVASGGHGISDDVIERRNVTSIKTLKAIIPLCDDVRVYDNTIAYNPMLFHTNGKTIVSDKNIPPHILSCLN